MFGFGFGLGLTQQNSPRKKMSEKHTKRATTLSSVSGLIIIFLLSGATLNEKGALFGGSFDYEHKQVLEWAAFLFLNFSMIRFMASSRTPLEKIQEKFCIKIRQIHNDTIDTIKDAIEAQVQELSSEDVSRLFSLPHGVSIYKISVENWPYFLAGRRSNRAFQIGVEGVSARVVVRAIGKDNKQIAASILLHPLGFHFVWATRARSFVDVILLSDDFWELFVPYLLYLSALILMIVAWFGVAPDSLVFPDPPDT